MQLPPKTENERYSKLKTKNQTTLRAVAQVKKVFGIRGEVKIFSYSRSAPEYEKIFAMFRGRDDRHVVPCEIERVTTRGEEIYLKLKMIDDRTAAEQIAGEYLFVEEQHRKQLPSGKFFDDDLLGCVVRNEDGKELGTVHDVVQYPAHKVYEVKTKSGFIMVPVVDEIVLSVNIEKREIVVRPPEGLFEGTMLE